MALELLLLEPTLKVCEPEAHQTSDGTLQTKLLSLVNQPL